MALMMRDNPAFEDDDGVIGMTKPCESIGTVQILYEGNVFTIFIISFFSYMYATVVKTHSYMSGLCLINSGVQYTV